MRKINQPSKEQVRHWLAERQVERKPLPDAKQIRQVLRWYTSVEEFLDPWPVSTNTNRIGHYR
jgi:hypothetical protein